MPQQLIDLYTHLYNVPPASVTPIAGQGSDRQYFRLSNQEGDSVIGTLSNDVDQNKMFFALTEALHRADIKVPYLLGINNEMTAYIQTDLGSVSLFDIINRGRLDGQFSPEVLDSLGKVIDKLPEIQFKGGEVARQSGLNLQHFNKRAISWDLNYFKYCFLKTLDLSIDENALENDFEHLTTILSKCDCEDTLLYRDFQSRNIIIGSDGQPGFIDYQSSRFGPIYYDLASLLWQARAGLTDEVRELMIDRYILSTSRFTALDPKTFRETLALFVFFRQLQTLGAYGFRGLVQHKQHFVDSLVPAINAILSHVGSHGHISESFPTLTSLLVTAQSRLSPTGTDMLSRLRVTVGSFSFKRGYPLDPSGNGGGYIFDCRGMHNPGRYDCYKSLTGADREVIDFLKDRGEADLYVSEVFNLVSRHIERYISRGFTSLAIWFGCTGGQHRSVYCANALARLLTEHFDNIDVLTMHREQPHLNK